MSASASESASPCSLPPLPPLPLPRFSCLAPDPLPDDVRREGAALPKPVFDRVVAEARRHHALG